MDADVFQDAVEGLEENAMIQEHDDGEWNFPRSTLCFDPYHALIMIT